MADELELETDDGDAVSISSVKAGGPKGDPLVFVSIGQADSRHVSTAALNPDEARTVGATLVGIARRLRDD